jgi:hypothetical protein
MRLQYPTAAGFAFSLAACAPGGFVWTVPRSDLNVGDDFAHEATVKDILVVVRGGAFGVDQKTLAAAVVDRMQGAAWGFNPRFTAEHGGNIGKMYSLVFFIGASDRVNALGLCAHPDTVQPITVPQSGDAIQLVGALCRFDKTVTSVAAFAGRVHGLDDPQFRTLVATATRDLTSNAQRPNRLTRDD